MTYEQMFEKMTGYVVGEISGAQLQEFEQILEKDSLLNYEVEELQGVVRLSSEAFVTPMPDLFALRDNQRENIFGSSLIDSASPVSPTNANNQNNDEMSGLIDIRKLAAMGTDKDEPGADRDELISMNSGTGSLFAPPILATKSVPRKSMKAVVGLTSVAVIGCLALFVLLGLRDANAQKVSQKETRIATLSAELERMEAAKSASIVEPVFAEVEVAPNKIDVEDKETEAIETPADPREIKAGGNDKSGGKAKLRNKNKSRNLSAKETQKEVPEKSEKKGEPEQKQSELDALLSGKNVSNVQEKLTKPQVVKGMNGVKAAVRNCGKGNSGNVKVRAVIRPNGRISTAITTGAFAGTPTGNCVVSAVKRASFPKTKNTLKVTYPFTL